MSCYTANIDPGKPAAEVSQTEMTYSSKTPCPDRVLPSTLHTSHCTLHSSHSKLHTSHSTLHTPHFSLLTASLTLQTSHFTLHTSHCTLHTSQSTLHTSHFTVHTSHFTLHSPHFHTALKPTCYKKTLVPKWRKSANKSMSQPSCSQSKTIYEIQLQETLRMQAKQEATLTQPFQCDLRRLSCKTQEKLRAMASEIVAPKPDLDARAKKKTILKHFLKGF